MINSPGLAALNELRDEETWYGIGCETDEEIVAWRSLGFIPSTAEPWVRAIPDLEGSPEVDSLVAASFLAGGLQPEDASAWMEAMVGLVPPSEMAAAAAEWIAAGFDASEAATWGHEIPIEVACEYRAAGWTVWEGLLHTEWLASHDVSNRDPMWLMLAPEQAIAYARAGLMPETLPHYEARRRAGEPMKRLIPWDRHHEQNLTPWVRRRLTELGDMAAQGGLGYAVRPIVDAEIPAVWEKSSYWPEDVEPPTAESWSVTTGDRWDGRRVPDDYVGCPEDYAVEPYLDWTDAHETAVNDWLVKRASEDEDPPPKISVYMEWPPQAYLTHPGWAYMSDDAGCMDHESLRRDCQECLGTEVGEPILDAAHWKFSVFVQYESADEEGETWEWQDREVLLTLVTDPRSVEYSTMPLR